MSEKWNPTVGTITSYYIIGLVLLTFIVTAIVNIFAQIEDTVGCLPRPQDPLLANIYDTLYIVYKFLKPILTNRFGIATIITLDMIVLAFETKWKRR